MKLKKPKVLDDIEKIRTEHLKFAEIRGFDKTYCPSEVARELFPQNWREMMDQIREIGFEMAHEGKLTVLQKGIEQDILTTELKGPIRFRKK